MKHISTMFAIALVATYATSAMAREITYKAPNGHADSPAGINWVQASDAAAKIYYNAVPDTEMDVDKIKAGLKLCGSNIRAHKFATGVGLERLENIGDVSLSVTPNGCMLVN